ncbi:MAG TPA: DNA repair protein RadA [Candidatus Krumholzibacteria bacterium]|nr:DNA repair protein RadA [Candidatus Krumholzibacteria bacterium]HPD71996.1 DNA repair protein RadA [Candidatus Krumholzibacteria bacterium]HRY41071.1 DNA repair protein RadA [Candidatus Krumholzibacteria bacterium]
MARASTNYVCGDCGHAEVRWYGRCPSCGAFGTFREFREASPASAGRGSRGFRSSGADPANLRPVPLREVDAARAARLPVEPAEIARVLGGGLVEGSVVLLGGEPGVGKSTLLTGLALNWSRRGVRVLYVAGEESPPQIRLRAERLGFKPDEEAGFEILAEVRLEPLLAALEDALAGQAGPAVIIADSVQTLHGEQVDAYPGSPTQIRYCGGTLADFARRHGCPVFLVGHVTKTGDLAGPKLLEHMVDTVLYFEGSGGGAIRLVRAVKNRFGTTGELAVLEMRQDGLVPVDDAGVLFLGGREGREPGAAVCAVRNGSRIFLVEVQALVAGSRYGTPQRVVQGVDGKRVALLAAILEKRAGLDLSGCDVFVKVAGGGRLDDPAADLAILAAIASSLRERPVPAGTLILGEVGLTGEVRPATAESERLREASRHGFTRAVCARPADGRDRPRPPRGLSVAAAESVEEAVALALSAHHDAEEG